MLNILGDDQKQLEEFGNKLKAKLKDHPALLDVDVNFRSGKPEFQVQPDKNQAQRLGMSTVSIGQELRAQVEGVTPAKYRENGLEYDVRVRLQEDQRDLRAGFCRNFVPNLNGSIVPLARVAAPVDAEGPSKITRQDRRRYVQIAADIRPGMGMGNAMKDIDQMLDEGDLKLPPGMSHKYIGQAEDFQELGQNMMFAMGAGILFIYLVLASLYESFVTPFTIMLAMPLAISGCFLMLFLGHKALDLFSMIGMVMLMGVAVKNSILLVDYAVQLIRDGMDRDSRDYQIRQNPLASDSHDDDGIDRWLTPDRDGPQ